MAAELEEQGFDLGHSNWFSLTRKDHATAAKQLKEKLEVLMTEWKAKDAQFIDKNFPANKTSLCKPSDNVEFSVSSWRRPKHVVVNNEDPALEWSLFNHSKNKADVVQGKLENCWAMTAMSLISTQPDLLDKIFVTKEYNRSGVYGMLLCLYGQWIEVIVDDLLPCDSAGCLVFGQAKRKQLWVPLLEKAIAKLYGSYAATASGSVASGLHLFTGQAVEMLITGKECVSQPTYHRFHTKLRQAISEGMLVMCCADQKNIDAATYAKVKLTKDHIYLMLNVETIHQNKLFRLKDSWGTPSWSGNWSQGSQNWRDVPKEQMPIEGIGGSEDGIFWISYVDILVHFRDVGICYVRSDWYDYHLSSKLPCIPDTYFQGFRIDVAKDTFVDIHIQEILQSPEALINSQTEALLVLYDAQWKLIGSHFGELNNLVLTKKYLRSGHYYAFCFSHTKWQKGEPVNYTLICHSSEEVRMTVFDYPANMMTDILYNYIVAVGERVEAHKPLIRYTVESSFWWGRMLAVANYSDTNHYAVKLTTTSEENITCSRGKQTDDCIPPRHRQILCMKTCENKDLDNWALDMDYTVRQALTDPANNIATSFNKPAIDNNLVTIHRKVPIETKKCDI